MLVYTSFCCLTLCPYLRILWSLIEFASENPSPANERARPLVVLGSAAILLVTSFFVRQLVVLLLLWCWSVLLALLTGASLARIMRALSRAWFYLALPVALNLAFLVQFQGASSNSAWLQWIQPSLLIGLRALTLVTISIVLMLLFSPQRYLDDLFRLRFGPALMRRWLSQLELLSGFTLSFVPQLAAESRRINLARSARGLPVLTGFTGKLKQRKEALFPLLVTALKRAESMALALRCRGYDPLVPKTQLTGRSLGLVDALKVLLVATGCAVMIILQSRLK